MGRKSVKQFGKKQLGRKERKQLRVGKQKRKDVKSPAISSSLNHLALEFAKVMTSVPRNPHISETFIDENKMTGCILGSDHNPFLYCQVCYYARGCQKDVLQWRLNSSTGRLSSYS